eukprot:TRINITY_DN5596_c0_g1_i1.p1 TRINITY_DN5596_c0_g1~~TRINITY_DN5596_c0_g1_i1.p1  ORF type:complete len:276 (-),score=37.84 TRINITY_DN5596_c0_g1_i1:120-947(-)
MAKTAVDSSEAYEKMIRNSNGNPLTDPMLGNGPGDVATGLETLDIKRATIEIRQGFVRKVYGILAVQLLITFIVATPIARMDPKVLAQARYQRMVTASAVLTLVTMLAMVCCRGLARTTPWNYLMLFVFTAAEGVLVGIICAQYTLGSVIWAVLLTAIIFGWMTAYAFTTKTDFTGFGPYLFGALCVMCAMSLFAAFGMWMGYQMKPLVMLYQACGVLLFTFYIIFDTQMMLGAWGGHKESFSIDDYVFAALNLYLDIINLLINLLALFGDQRDS